MLLYPPKRDRFPVSLLVGFREFAQPFREKLVPHLPAFDKSKFYLPEIVRMIEKEMRYLCVFPKLLSPGILVILIFVGTTILG